MKAAASATVDGAFVQCLLQTRRFALRAQITPRQQRRNRPSIVAQPEETVPECRNCHRSDRAPFTLERLVDGRSYVRKESARIHFGPSVRK
jgi:hypothetical protein